MKREKPVSRVTRTKEEAKTSYDKMSGWYDVLAGIAEKKYKEAGLQKLNVGNGEKVLEIGYGTGQCIIALARSVGVSGKVYGIDLSEGMYRVAKSKVEKARLLERVELICGDAAELPYNENCIDAIFVCFTLELFDTPEITIVLKQCQRVLYSGGRICVVVMAKRKAGNLMVTLYDWAHEKFPQYADCRPIYAQKALEETGFDIECVTEMSMFGLPVDIILATIEMKEKPK
jgi:demethylmenaquinone methyltransferase/2-methoxy-6-polyprenyl-1,4-benzoquinol methylase